MSRSFDSRSSSPESPAPQSSKTHLHRHGHGMPTMVRNTGREVRATLALTIFALSQWVMPQAVLLQCGLIVTARADSNAAERKTSSAKINPAQGSQKSGKGPNAPLGSGRQTTRRAAATLASEGSIPDSAPSWYKAARVKEARRIQQTKKGVKMLLAQNLDTLLEKKTKNGGGDVRITKLTPNAPRAEAASGIPLLRANFPGDVRASAELSAPPFYSPLRLSLKDDRIPTQTEVVAAGGLAGPLSPVAPAEPETFANEVDAKLKAEGFEQGLQTPLPTEAEAIARQSQLPGNKRAALNGLVAAAHELDAAKMRVKKARAQNREFAEAMVKWDDNHFQEAAEAMETYAKKYPKSPWTPEALIHRANYAKFTGQGNEAEDLYRQVMKMTSEDPKDPSYNAHRKAFGRLTDLYLIEKRYGEVRPMLEDFLNNDTNWRRRTWGLYWLRQLDAIDSDPKRRLAERDCGSQALAALLVQLGRSHGARAVAGLEPKSERGFSLAELQGLARRQQVSLVGFEAQAPQLLHLPLPLLLHYSDKIPPSKTPDMKNGAKQGAKVVGSQAMPYGHFVVVRSYDARKHQWQVLNPQDGTQAWLSAKGLTREWSGRGLMLASTPRSKSIVQMARAATPSKSTSVKPVIRLSMAQMKATYGTGYGVKGQSDLGCSSANQGCNNGSCGQSGGGAVAPGGQGGGVVGTQGGQTGGGAVAPGGQPGGGGKLPDMIGKSPGSPSISVNRITQNIYITDTPLWYQPAKGPMVDITVSYNSQDASNYNTVVGNKWSFGYGSYIAEMPNRVMVYMPDGKQNAFVPTTTGNPVGGTYLNPRGDFSTLSKTADNTWTLTKQGGDKVSFGIPTGISTTIPVLLELRDRWNQTLTFAYGVVGGKVVPFTITDADGKVTRLQYDGAGHLIYAQTPDERQASFSYDANGNLIQCVDAEGQAFQYAYDELAIVTQLNTAQGPWFFTRETIYSPGDPNAATHTYRTNVFNPSGSAPERFEFFLGRPFEPYHTTGRYSYTDHRGNVTVFTVTSLSDPANNLSSAITSTSTPGGQTSSSTYGQYSDPGGNVLSPTTSSTGSLNTSVTYNAQGLPLTIIVSDSAYSGRSRTTNLTYSSDGLNVTGASVVGSDGINTLSQVVLQSATYNAAHQPTQTVDNTGRVTNFTYTAWGAPATISTIEGSGAGAVTHTTQYVYGTTAGSYDFNRVVNIVQDSTTQATYTHDSSGRVRSATDAQGVTLIYRYNNLDAVTDVLYPDGTHQATDYTCCSLPGMVTDRSGRRSYYDYDALKRLVRVQDADGQTLQFGYDAEGNRTDLLDAKGTRTRWVYDGDNRVVQKAYADSRGESYTYANYTGLPTSSTNGRGQTASYSYGAFYQPSGINYPNSPDVGLSYDVLGHITGMTDGSGTTSWDYDSYGRLQDENGPWTNDTVGYGYDTLGRIAGMSVVRSATSSDSMTMAYDALGRLSSVAGNMGDFGTVGTFGYSYVGNTSKLAQMTRPNGVNTNYSYEAAGSLRRLTNVANVAATGGANVSNFGYAYDTGGAPAGFRDNRTSQSKKYGSETTQTVSYGYNATSMLTGESGAVGGASTPALSFTYGFDSMGNRTLAANNTAQTRTDSTYNSLNQLTSQSSYNAAPTTPVLTGSQVFGYDGDGNMSQILSKDAAGTVTGTATYGYDDASRLTSITSASVKWDFVYDGLSRLRTSTYSTGSAGNWVVQSEKRRVYSGMDVVQERDNTNTVTASILRVGNIGGILSRSTGVADHTYFSYDGGGNVTTLTNGLGATVGSYNYDAWGNLLASSGTKAAENPYRFSTKEAIAGLYYYGYRFYSSGLGRWINRDPISEKGGTNLYGFVQNNTTSQVDAYGLAGWDTLVFAIVGVVSSLVGQIVANIAKGKKWDCDLDISDMLSSGLAAAIGSLISPAAAGFLAGVIQTYLSDIFSGGGIDTSGNKAGDAFLWGVLGYGSEAVGWFFSGLKGNPAGVIGSAVVSAVQGAINHLGQTSSCPTSTCCTTKEGFKW